MTDKLQHYEAPQAVTSKGAIQLGMDNMIRNRIGAGKVQLKVELAEIINDIVTHYMGCASCSDAFTKEATDFIINRFGSIGTNEIREAFRLSAANVLNVKLHCYVPSLSILGDCLTAYIDYRRPIAAEIRKASNEEQLLKEKALNEERKRAYEREVLQWWEYRHTKQLSDCRFYIYDTLKELGIVTSPDDRQKYIDKAMQQIQGELIREKERQSDIYKAREYSRRIANLFVSDQKSIVNRAKELYLYDLCKG